MSPTAIPQQVIAIQNLSGDVIQAPIAVWVGCILQSLPPDMREEIIGFVGQYIGMAAAQGQPSRIVAP